MLKVKLTKDQEKSDLLKAIGSNKKEESMAAQEILANFTGPIIEQVLDQSASSNLVYDTRTYDFGTTPSIPLDLYDGNEEGLISVWSQSMAGGLPTNLVHGMSDMRLTTYRLDSAVSFLKQYARDARLDVVNKGIQRMAQEVLIKTERNAWAPLLKALADSTDNAGEANLIDATTTDVFQVDDLNRLWTMIKRLRKSWVNGTPTTSVGQGLTDMVVSPEIVQQIRSFAYQPMNTRGAPDSTESTALALPDSVRSQFFTNSGVPEIFGVGLIELLEFGVGEAYNVLFDSFFTASGSEPTFDSANDELVLGLDLSVDAFVRAASSNPETNSTFTTEVDDQFVRRSDKWGWYGYVEEARAVLDSKATVGLIV